MNIVDQIYEVNPKSLPSVSFQEKKYLPTVSGIYLVISDIEVVYIGQAVNIRDRWKAHNQASLINGSDRIAWIECDEEFLTETELTLIERFRPRLNTRSLRMILPEINKSIYSVNELMERYGLSARQAVYDRINSLGINTTNNGKRGTVTESDMKLLDELHKRLCTGQGLGNQKVRGTISSIKGNLRLLKEYYEGKKAMNIAEVLMIIEKTLIEAEKIN